MALSKPRVFVVIPNWNARDFVGECLQALERQTLPHEVIIVENGSTDGSAEFIRETFPHLQLLAFPDNAGFAGGVNRGIRPALEQGADYVVLLNNDAIPAPDWLECLVRTAETYPEFGIITSKIRYLDDSRLDSTGDFYTTWGMPFPRGRSEVDEGQYDKPDQQVVFGASGGASLYRADMLRQIGLFDERFFLYYEDVDISFRAQLAGWPVRYAPTAVVRHCIGGTSSRFKNRHGKRNETATPFSSDTPRPSSFARYYSARNFIYLYTKNMPARLFWTYLPLFWVSWALLMASDLKAGLIMDNLKANASALMHLPGVLVDRWRIQRGRRVSTEYIDHLLYHGRPPLQVLRLRHFFYRLRIFSSPSTNSSGISPKAEHSNA
jgi:GT2 family glycosyltransferase